MSIPRNVIAAAEAAVLSHCMDGQHGPMMDEETALIVRKAVEAAAPFIAAQAVWDATLQIDTHQFGTYAAPYISAVRDQLRAGAPEVSPQ